MVRIYKMWELWLLKLLEENKWLPEKKDFVKGDLMSQQLNTSRDFAWDVCYKVMTSG